jgi:hypothetical protein
MERLSGWKTVTVALSETILQPWFGKGPQTNEGIGEQGHDMAQHCCQRKGGCQCKHVTSHHAFGASLCHADANGQSAGIVVGDWGTWSKIEATGAGVGNGSVKSWKDWGRDSEWLQSIECNNNCFYTSYYCQSKLNSPVRCRQPILCLHRYCPSCWCLSHCLCAPCLCSHRSHSCAAG